jgi:hypothetical protein
MALAFRINSPVAGRRLAFGYALGWLGVLVALAAMYTEGDFRTVLRGVPFSGVAAGWAGALGGIAISLKGVYEHGTRPAGGDKREPWDNDLLIWHLGRPASGVIVGIAVYILLKTAYPSGSPSAGAMAAAAFILGTQEKRFFGWIKQIGAVVVAVPRDPVPSDTLKDKKQNGP